jgi:predicted RND superfamily exporter protein
VALVLVTVGIAAFSFQQLPKINIETVFLNFMNETSNIKRSTNYIQAHLGGVSPLEISIESAKEEGILNPSVLKQLDAFQQFLNAMSGVDKTVSIVEFVKEMHQAVNNEDPASYIIPDSADLIAQYIFTYSLSGRDNDLDDFVDYNYQIARIRGRITQGTSAQLQQTLQQVQTYIDNHFGDDLNVVVTSYSVIQTSMISKLISGQIEGLAIAFIVMFSVFLLVSRSVMVALLCMIPNLLPIIASAGLMAYMGFSLNAGTAMIACITFGLVVDDTLHFLYHHKQAAKSGLSRQSVIDTVLSKVGPPVIYSSLILAAGFALLMLGDSFFTYSFGLLCAFSILCAMACNLTVMPYFVYHFGCFKSTAEVEKQQPFNKATIGG